MIVIVNITRNNCYRNYLEIFNDRLLISKSSRTRFIAAATLIRPHTLLFRRQYLYLYWKTNLSLG